VTTLSVLSWLLEHWPSILSALGGLGAVVTSWMNKSKIQEVHLTVNGRLTELLEKTRIVAHAEGRAEVLREIESKKQS
jgi:hypothetical protein